MPSFTPPPGYPRIKVVESFPELITTPFSAGINAICWQRTLAGDFSEIVDRLGVTEAMETLDAARLQALELSEAGSGARDILLQDLELLRAHDLAPVLNCIQDYERDDDSATVPTDVYSFHADSAPVEVATFLCTYYGPPSEGLRNDEAHRRVDVPATRARLMELFGGEEGDEFREFLAEHCYDLHYAAALEARPFPSASATSGALPWSILKASCRHAFIALPRRCPGSRRDCC